MRKIKIVVYIILNNKHINRLWKARADQCPSKY